MSFTAPLPYYVTRVYTHSPGRAGSIARHLAPGTRLDAEDIAVMMPWLPTLTCLRCFSFSPYPSQGTLKTQIFGCRLVAVCFPQCHSSILDPLSSFVHKSRGISTPSQTDTALWRRVPRCSMSACPPFPGPAAAQLWALVGAACRGCQLPDATRPYPGESWDVGFYILMLSCYNEHASFKIRTTKSFKKKATRRHPSSHRVGRGVGREVNPSPSCQRWHWVLGGAAGGSLHFSHLGTSGVPGE